MAQEDSGHFENGRKVCSLTGKIDFGVSTDEFNNESML